MFLFDDHLVLHYKSMLYASGDIPRFLLIFAASFALVFAFPILSIADPTDSIIHVLLIFSFLIGFLTNRALERKQTLSTNVANELARLRRVHHLSEFVSDVVWQKQLHKALEQYHQTLAANFVQHQETNKLFRHITHLIYSCKTKNKREEQLWNDLLQTTRDLSIERQRIEQALVGGLSWYSWLVMGTYAAIVIILLILSRQHAGLTYFSVGVTTAGVLLVTDLLFRLDRLSDQELAQFTILYKQNLPKRRNLAA